VEKAIQQQEQDRANACARLANKEPKFTNEDGRAAIRGEWRALLDARCVVISSTDVPSAKLWPYRRLELQAFGFHKDQGGR
jgi:hypothetical protein